MTLVSPDWVETHVRVGHELVGALYPNYDGGDIWSGKLGRVRGIKEGDTPTFLALVRNGLNVPARLDLGGWGGRIVDFEDAMQGNAAPGDPNPGMISVYRWRAAWQPEFQARLDWCVRDAKQANHPPEVKLRVNRLELDARGSSDPDGDKITYEWLVYPQQERPVVRGDRSDSSRAFAPEGENGACSRGRS